jgi:hypothetical protein
MGSGKEWGHLNPVFNFVAVSGGHAIAFGPVIIPDQEKEHRSLDWVGSQASLNSTGKRCRPADEG